MIAQKSLLAILLLASLANAPVHADPVQNLTTFTSGSPARASEVNDNFTEVANSVNDTDQRVVELEAQVTQPQGELTAQQTQTVELQAQLTTQQTQAAELQAQITALQGRVGNLPALNDFVSVELVNGQPTIRVTAANLQIVNGLSETTTANGTGNLLIGYDEERISGDEQCSIGTDPVTELPVPSEAACLSAGGLWALSHKSGSHYLIVGGRHNYSRWGGIVVGDSNTSNFDMASVSGGTLNTASGRVSMSAAAPGIRRTAARPASVTAPSTLQGQGLQHQRRRGELGERRQFQYHRRPRQPRERLRLNRQRRLRQHRSRHRVRRQRAHQQ